MTWKAFAVMAAFAAQVWAADNRAPNFSVVDEIVAKVNGDIVTKSELEKNSREVMGALQQQGLKGNDLQQAASAREKDVLRDRIDQLLLVQRAKDLNINVDTEVSKYMADLQRQEKIADPDKFHELVRQQSGMPFEDFRQDVKNNMLTRNVIGQEVARKINVSHDEIAAYYNAHKTEFVREEKVFLREILVSTDGKDAAATTAAEKKSTDLYNRASKGERFADLARDNSDAATAAQGGDLGGYTKGYMPANLENIVWTMKPGEVTKPIKTEHGFLILKVEDHTKAGQASLADVEDEIREKLYSPRMQPKIREYLTELRKSAFLEIKPGFVDSGAAPGMDTKWKDPAQLKPETVTKAEVIEKTRHKRLLWLVPIPGTEETVTGKSSSR
jgi:peptidyl-prolyl cis-trans isomerase SurA